MESNRPVATSWHELATPQGVMWLYRAVPQGAQPQRAIVVLQEAFGVNAHIQDVTNRAAAAGYVAVAPQLFHRTGTDTVEYSDHPAAMELIGALGREEIASDITAVCDHLASADGIALPQIGLMGFCFGGRAAITAATALPGLGATAAFYGPGVAAGQHAVLDRFGEVTGPVLHLSGDEDPTIPAEHLDAIRAAGQAAGKDVRIEVFPGAGHAFHCDARPAMYRAEQAQKAWGLAMDLFASSL
ncbi:dienelactone hydrolase family protein [Asanoa sp. NPDC049573]|uniref:dienelactone hydrolase family protein n=1 Tax=Asanoa sp. NPDC049573 TaxID=3155396 RepID=UPI003425FBE0